MSGSSEKTELGRPSANAERREALAAQRIEEIIPYLKAQYQDSAVRAQNQAVNIQPAIDAKDMDDFYKAALDPVTTFVDKSALKLEEIEVPVPPKTAPAKKYPTSCIDKTIDPSVGDSKVPTITADQASAAKALKEAFEAQQKIDAAKINGFETDCATALSQLSLGIVTIGLNPENKLHAIQKFYRDHQVKLTEIHTEQTTRLTAIINDTRFIEQAYGIAANGAEATAIKNGLIKKLSEKQAAQSAELEKAYADAMVLQLGASNKKIIGGIKRYVQAINPELMQEPFYLKMTLSGKSPFPRGTSSLKTRNGNIITRDTETGALTREKIGFFTDRFRLRFSGLDAKRAKRETEDIRDHLLMFCASQNAAPDQITELVIDCTALTAKDYLNGKVISRSPNERKAQQYWMEAVKMGIKPEVIKGYTPTETDKASFTAWKIEQDQKAKTTHASRSTIITTLDGLNAGKASLEGQIAAINTQANNLITVDAATAARTIKVKPLKKDIESYLETLAGATELIQTQLLQLAELRKKIPNASDTEKLELIQQERFYLEEINLVLKKTDEDGLFKAIGNRIDARLEDKESDPNQNPGSIFYWKNLQNQFNGIKSNFATSKFEYDKLVDKIDKEAKNIAKITTPGIR